MHEFIRVGDSIIATSFIAHISREGTDPTVIRIWSKNPQIYWDMHEESPEGVAIERYFRNSDICYDLALDVEQQKLYQQHLSRGGQLSFDSFISKARTHKRLMTPDRPSKEALQEASRLEQELKL